VVRPWWAGTIGLCWGVALIAGGGRGRGRTALLGALTVSLLIVHLYTLAASSSLTWPLVPLSAVFVPEDHKVKPLSPIS